MSAGLAFSQLLLLGNAHILAAALVYAGSTDQTNGMYYEAPPNALRLKFVVTAGTYGGNTVTGTLQTSNDGSTWVSAGLTTGAIAADGTTEMVVNTFVMKYLRVEFTGAASATIAVFVFADIPSGAFSEGIIYDQERSPVNGYAWCNCAVVLDSGVALGGASTAGTGKQLPGPTATCGYLKVVTTGRTQGTVTPKVQWSPDGTTYYDTGDALSAISTNTTTWFKLTKGAGAYFRVYYTVAASCDATVTTTLVTDGSWS